MAEESITVNLTVTATPSAARTPLTISKTVTPTALRQQASDATKIPLGTLRLIFAGKLIKDDNIKPAVTEFRLEDGCVLHCMGKPVEEAASNTNNASAAPAALAAGSSVTMQPGNINNNNAMTAADPLQAAFATLRSSNAPSVYVAAVTTLDKVLSNIINKPMEEKYRKVKQQNPAFQKRLGGLPGGDAAMKATGFVTEKDESGEDVYMMHASEEAWPQLVATKTAVEVAVRDAQVAANPPAPMMPGMMGAGAGGAIPGMAGFPGMNMPNNMPGGGMGGAGMPGMPPGMNPADMQNAAARMMADPQALQTMLQNPMVQNMMRNDPRFANNPMMQQSMEQLASNPAMIQQLSQMMRDPNMQQQMQAMMNSGGGAGMGMPGMGMPPGGAGFGANNANNNAGNTNNAGGQQQQQGGGGGGASDEQMTEEDMIAEAIRRSLEAPP